ncbi:MAG: hypothetical protein V1923_06265, partial [Candidatus Omnitrophota bacterium]
AENYVHRIGRTARAGCRGHAISFATPEQSCNVRDIEKLIRSTLPVSRHPEVPSEKFVESRPEPLPRKPKGRYPKHASYKTPHSYRH